MDNSNRILFMIINNEVKYLQNSTMDHREWYTSLGFDPNNFDNIVRGYIIEHKIVFFKGMNFNYDEEVIQMARMYSPSIREACHDSSLEVYCGIVVNSYGSKWEPVLRVLEEEITGISAQVMQEQVAEVKPVNDMASSSGTLEAGPILEFKNDYQDDAFCKRAILVTGVVLLLTVIIKVILFSMKGGLHLNNFMDVLLAFSQILLLILTIYGYSKKLPATKYFGLVASILLVLTLNIFDVILGILYFLFSVDQGYFVSFFSFCRKIISKEKSS